MGFSEKHQVEGGLESDSRKWVIAGIGFRQLRSINTRKPPCRSSSGEEEEDAGEQRCTTPTGREARIPERRPCPAAPRKRRPAAQCHVYGGAGGVREFFNPPELESIFVRHVERAN